MESSEQAGLTSEPSPTRRRATYAYPWLKSYPKQYRLVPAFQRRQPLPAFLDQAAARFAARPATGFFGQTMTYAELADARSTAPQKGCKALGVGKGTRVGLLFPNCPAFVVYYYAILKAGGTVVSFNPLYTIPELTHSRRRTRAPRS